MSRPFANYKAKPTFAQHNDPTCSSYYTNKKKITSSFCEPNICHPKKNLKSYDKYYGTKDANNYRFNKTIFYYNKSQLYSNLYTKLDLRYISGNTPIISNLTNGIFPIIINTSVDPYLTYNIDPSGNLFGNSLCDINNYVNYIKLDVSSNDIST
jgi:hypothetical protein